MGDAAIDNVSLTTHGGAIKVVLPRTVRIRGQLAAVLGDQHICAITTHTGVNVITSGSARVKINGQPAARKDDTCTCGASIQVGAPGVTIA
jgi:uncharacterized Zn-binding protein involved in type VI secretion